MAVIWQLTVPANYVPHFKIGEELRERVDRWMVLFCTWCAPPVSCLFSELVNTVAKMASPIKYMIGVPISDPAKILMPDFTEFLDRQRMARIKAVILKTIIPPNDIKGIGSNAKIHASIKHMTAALTGAVLCWIIWVVEFCMVALATRCWGVAALMILHWETALGKELCQTQLLRLRLFSRSCWWNLYRYDTPTDFRYYDLSECKKPPRRMA